MSTSFLFQAVVTHEEKISFEEQLERPFCVSDVQATAHTAEKHCVKINPVQI